MQGGRQRIAAGAEEECEPCEEEGKTGGDRGRGRRRSLGVGRRDRAAESFAASARGTAPLHVEQRSGQPKSVLQLLRQFKFPGGLLLHELSDDSPLGDVSKRSMKLPQTRRHLRQKVMP
jgi:hypothetical protein